MSSEQHTQQMVALPEGPLDPYRYQQDDQLDSQIDKLKTGQHLVYRDGTQVRHWELGDLARIGRSLRADLRFEDAGISRRHALVVRDGNRYRLMDDRSLNGVYVNGRRVSSHVLSDGDEIQLGRHRVVYVDPQDRAGFEKTEQEQQVAA